MLMFPEGDHSRRRHAHAQCVLEARKQGRLPSRSEYEKTQPRPAESRTRLRNLLRRSPKGK